MSDAWRAGISGEQNRSLFSDKHEEDFPKRSICIRKFVHEWKSSKDLKGRASGLTGIEWNVGCLAALTEGTGSFWLTHAPQLLGSIQNWSLTCFRNLGVYTKLSINVAKFFGCFISYETLWAGFQMCLKITWKANRRITKYNFATKIC